ncbi:variable surface protein [Plasmodium gonderi]|uniref:Variable surface protein n=1 Tax=Plasmodium gonderi TaxID=77519 RepID=A0A1Y1JXC2_PLAGO|nr:variable surface protein [Plasmodium gonderi]GAW84454.1 variable surface protein [Plasmodium gonderi]
MDLDKSCRDVLYYLKYIDEHIGKSNSRLEASCKYFFYKEGRRLQYSYTLSDICLNYANANDIDDDTYNKLQILGKLHNIYGKFEQIKDICHSVNTILKQYKILLDDYESMNDNRSFTEELDKFKKEYNGYIQKSNECDIAAKILEISSVTETKEDIITDKSLVTSASRSENAVTGIDTGTGVGIFTVVLLICIFILYKYTTFGLFLKNYSRKDKNIKKHIYIYIMRTY